MHHQRSLSPIPDSQGWACGPSAFHSEFILIRESVDSLCRDGTDTPIVRVHTKDI